MKLPLLALCVGLVMLTGCGTTHVRGSQDVQLFRDAHWLVLPMVNRTTTPQAGLRAQAITEAVLAQHGVSQVESYRQQDGDGLLFEAASEASQRAMTQWASQRDGDYVVSGVVHEWRYKTGVDGEPAVGVMLEIRDGKGALLYSGTGSRAGWARQSLGETGQRVIDKLLAPVLD
ncbi:hypothetical protein ACRYJU_16835 [Alloalcanivorax xenomutans]|uniref:hypothetical protein n=1 Tax=Alloalcanivorax xenomutans TaxID=1094342 RepID=UPI0006D5CA9B|nr:hypothetical protein [Alloalcanivorax xenomutans]MBA4722887.1 hypothetical protein [Alcanivorax sp.]PHS64923.1 MAG: hypothetical protein COB00_10900 [Alcanivorax sp.]CUR47553.1 Extracellular Matrix protein PelC [Alloalcanivorax xenomutans]SOC04158.1 hypothetical protein SAMN05877962_10673 [Alloalcanivorax xenomutans]